MGRLKNEPLSLFLDLVIDKSTMVKKGLSSSNDTVFRYEIPGSPSKVGAEAQNSIPDSPGSVFLRWVHPVCPSDDLSHPTGVALRAPSSSPEGGFCQVEREGTAQAPGLVDFKGVHSKGHDLLSK